MKRIGSRLKFLATLGCVFLLGSVFSFDVYSQEETDVAQSMGVGMKSRFASGATPIQIERTQIVPGTPMSVNSTMNNIMTSNGSGSFGGILSRYDTSTFGKFFGTGTMAERASSSRISALDDLAAGDNEVENIDTEKMYPPRLALDFNDYPTRSIESASMRLELRAQVKNALSRFELDPKEEFVRVGYKDDVIFLRGKVKNARVSRLLESVVCLQVGERRVVNEIEVLQKETNNVDVFGNSLD